MNTPITVAAVQMVSGTDPDANLATARTLVLDAAARGARLVVLPEYFVLMGMSDRDKLAIAETPGDGPLQAATAAIARDAGVWLIAGTLPLRADVADKVRNTTLVFDPAGVCRGRYDKIHLFGFSGLGERYSESDTIDPGSTPVVVDTAIGRVGLSVCYDLRFPELYRGFGEIAAFALPAAFTAVTGEAHWEPLIRARAIENQCYAIASAQGGTHPSGRKTHGHSMIVDPWGKVLAELAQGEGVITADLDPGYMASVRTRLPALRHRVL